MRLAVVERRVGLGLRLDDARDLVAVDASQRFAHGRAAEAVAALGHRVAADAPCVAAVDVGILVLVGQRQHPVAVVGVGQVGRPREVLLLHVDRVHFQFETGEARRTDVGLHRRVGRRVGQRDREDHVVGHLVVVVGHDAQAVLEHPQIEPDVELRGSLPAQRTVGHRRGDRRRVAGVVLRRAVRTVGVVQPDAVVARHAVAHAQFQVVDRPHVPELLVRDVPCGGAGGKEAPLVARREFRRTVGAGREREDVTLVEVIVHAAEIGDQHLLRILVAGREVAARLEHGHLVRRRIGRIGRQVAVALGHVVVTGRHADLVALERAVEIEVGRELIAQRLRARLGAAASLFERIALVVVAAAVVVVVHGVLRRGGQPVDDLPVEVEVARGALVGAFAVVVGLVPHRRVAVFVVAAAQQVAVGVVVAVCGCDQQTASEAVEVVVDERVADRTRQVEGRRGRQPLRNLEIGAAVHREDRVVGHRHHAAVVGITHRRGVFHVLVAARHAHVGLRPQRVAEPVSLLVCIGEDDRAPRHRIGHAPPACGNRLAVAQEARGMDRAVAVARAGGRGRREHRRAVVRLGDRRTHERQELLGIHEIPFARRRLPADLPLEDDLRPLAHRTFLGGDQNHAVRRPRAVDAGRRSVFQHLDRLDVVGVDVVHGARDPVDDDDRRIALVDRRTAADEERRRLARQRVGRRDLHTRNLAFQGVAHRGHGSRRHRTAGDLRHGRRKRMARLRAVPHDHHLVHVDRRGGERHVHDRLRRCDRHFGRAVAHKRNLQHGIVRRHAQRIAAVDVGRHAGGRPLDDDRRPHDRGALVVAHHAAQRPRHGLFGHARHGTARDDDAPSVYFIAHVLSRKDLREDVLDRFVLRRDRDPTLHVDLAGIDRKRIVRLLQGGDRPLHGYVFQVQGDVVSRRLRRQKQRRRHNDSETKRFYTRNR